MKIVVHLGYPKTMSKYLQLHVFDKIKSVNYLKPEGKNYLIYHEIRDNVLSKSNKDFDKNIENLKKKIFHNLSKSKINLFSDEIYLWPNKQGFEKTFERLNKVFSIQGLEKSFIIFHRNKNMILRSMYCQNINSFLNLDKKYIDFSKLLKDFKKKKYKNRKKKIFFKYFDEKYITRVIKKNYKLNLFRYEKVIGLNNNAYLKKLSILLKCDIKNLKKKFSKKPINESEIKGKNFVVKNHKTVELIRLFMLNRYILSLIPMNLKLIVKNFLMKINAKQLPKSLIK